MAKGYGKAGDTIRGRGGSHSSMPADKSHPHKSPEYMQKASGHMAGSGKVSSKSKVRSYKGK